jgi:hypothetical protein
MTAPIEELLSIANTISRGEIPEYQYNECFTSGAFDLLLINARDAKAYELLSQLCQCFESVKNSGNGMKGYYYLLTELARQTNTTEMPSGLQAIIVENLELSRELQVWYCKTG